MEEMTEITLWSEETCDCSASRALSRIKHDKKFHDVTVKAGGKSIRAHRNVLAAKIPYFRMMFNSNMKECSEEDIPMHEVDVDSMECLINFAYTGNLKIMPDKAISLLRTSIYLQIDFVSAICAEYLLTQLDKDNAFDLYEFAKEVHNSDILGKVEHYFQENFSEISKLQPLAHLSFDKMRDFISRDDLYVICEEEVYEAILSWIKESLDDRSVHFPKLLRHIRMSLLSPQYLLQRIYDDRLIRKSPQCPFLLETLNKLIMPMNMLECNVSKPNERQWKEKQHLKCDYLVGQGMYSVSLENCMGDLEQEKLPDTLKINYYDHLKQEWVPLYETKLESPIVYYTFCTNENIYFISNGWLSSFDFQTLTYTCSEMEIVPHNAGVALHDRKIYFFGGDENKPILCFDFLRGNQCVLAGQMLMPRMCARATSLGENIYLTGGYYNKNPLITAEKYNPITKQSTGIAHMNLARAQHSICALNGKIYVCGGLYQEDIYPLEEITGEFYDPLVNKWTFFLKNSNPRSPVSLVAYGHRLYATDYFPEDSHFLVNSYDPFDKAWKSGESLCSDKHISLCVVTTGSASAVPRLNKFDFLEKPQFKDVVSTRSKQIKPLENSSDLYWQHRLEKLRFKDVVGTSIKEIQYPNEKSSGSGNETPVQMFNFACWTEEECSCAASKMFAEFNDMKDGGELCDVIIRVGEKCFKAHSNILVAREKDSKIPFNSYMTETVQRKIVFDDVDPASIQCLINYVYTRRFEIPLSKVQSLLRTAIYLQIEYIFEHLLKQPNPSCAQEICEVAKDANSSAYVFEKVKLYLTENFHEIWECRAFLELPYLILKEIISSNDLYVKNETEVFKAVLWWLKASLEDRSAHFPELLMHVRLSLINHEYLIQCLNNDELIHKSHQYFFLLKALRDSQPRLYWFFRDILRECTPIAEKTLRSIPGTTLTPIPDRLVSDFSDPRHSEFKQHLKCAEMKEQGLYYFIFHPYRIPAYFHYYDHFNRNWVRLFKYEPHKIFDYLFCTEEKIYFISKGCLSSFDLKTLKYSESTFTFNDVPEHADVALHQGKLYFFIGRKVFKNVEHRFDSDLRPQMGELVKERYRSKSVSLGSCIYITGGYLWGVRLKSAEKYNPITQKSIKITEMQIPRYHHSATVLNEKIYVYGGHNDTFYGKIPNSKICEFYNPLTEEWTFLKMNCDVPFSASLFTYDSKLYLIGSSPERTSIYDPSEGDWESSASLSSEEQQQVLFVFVTGSAFSTHSTTIALCARAALHNPERKKKT